MVTAVIFALCLGADSELISRRDFFSPVSITTAQLSPDGERVSFVEDGVLKVWEDGRTSAFKPVFRSSWLPDSQSLLIESDQGLAIWGLDGKTTAVSLPTGARVLQLVTPPTTPGRAAVALATPEVADSGLHEIDLATGKTKLIEHSDRFNRWYVNARLQPVAASRVGPEEVHISYKTPGGEWKPISSHSQVMPPIFGIAGSTVDGAKVFYVSNPNRDTTALFELDRETGESRELASNERVDYLTASVALDPQTGQPLWAFGYFPRMERKVLDPSITPDLEALAKVKSGDISVVNMSSDRRKWLVRFMDGGPLDYYLYDSSTRQAKFLFTDTPVFKQKTLAERKGHVVAARDGLRLPIDVYLPPGSDKDRDGVPDQPLPTVMVIHGGPWVGFEWNFWEVNRSLQLLANRGYAVIKTEFRGAAGYGKKFLDAGDREWGAKMNDDLLDVAKWAGDKKIADPKRIGLWGWSYGGYAIYAAMAFTPGVFACGLPLYGPADILATEPNSLGFHPFWRRRVGDPTTEEGKELLRSRSPINFVDRIRAPLFIAQGLRDNRVIPAHSQRMAEALEKAGKAYSYIEFPEEGHDLQRAESWEAYWSLGEQFLKKHLGGQAQPPADELEKAGVKVVKPLG